MKYFVPKLEPAKEFNAQTEIKEKLGGLPFGLPTKMYPICKQCRHPMSLLAQFVHDKERLNLKRDGRVLFIFQCNNVGADFSTCPTWEADSGANACFVVEAKDLTNKTENLPGGKIELEKEFWVTGWEEKTDDVTETESVYFLDVEKYEELDDEAAEEVFNKMVDITKLGSVPSWIQYPEIPEGEWKFVGQLDSDTGFDFGDAGIGYIFIEDVLNPAQLPKGKFLWQCG